MKKWLLAIAICVALALAVFSSRIGLMPGIMPITVPTASEKQAAPENGASAQIGEIDRLLKRMEPANLAFNAPRTINIKDAAEIELVLSPTDSIEQLKAALTAAGEKVGATVRVSERMEARLSGQNFQITAITSELQAVSRTRETRWRWEIHPQETGEQKLHLTLTAILEIDGKSTPRTLRTFDKHIEVTVTPGQQIAAFFKNNWQWLWAVILVPIVGRLWKRRQAADNAD